MHLIDTYLPNFVQGIGGPALADEPWGSKINCRNSLFTFLSKPELLVQLIVCLGQRKWQEYRHLDMDPVLLQCVHGWLWTASWYIILNRWFAYLAISSADPDRQDIIVERKHLPTYIKRVGVTWHTYRPEHQTEGIELKICRKMVPKAILCNMYYDWFWGIRTTWYDQKFIHRMPVYHKMFYLKFWGALHLRMCKE